MKHLQSDSYKGYKIDIYGKFKSNYCTWDYGNTDVVILEYKVTSPSGQYVMISERQKRIAMKEKGFKFLFIKFPPSETLEETVHRILDDIIIKFKKQIDIKITEKEMTDGLLSSLKKVE
ncbi:hypothetical protein LCM23_13045 [Cytobacillus kochii]|uniref:hypothetical protein n=1 Tax=Cytobacillus kochii TaxID=859143 RepID=UPI001CD47B8D|nr:hypothetical protein [Cytobacillus kochii]MCA1027021.1 hypothetical protein [Cytobacillus kochii]